MIRFTSSFRVQKLNVSFREVSMSSAGIKQKHPTLANGRVAAASKCTQYNSQLVEKKKNAS